MKKDNLFEEPVQRFSFNKDVAEVFDDMLNRSVPFYSNILKQIAQVSSWVIKKNENKRVYDLGCSTGALVPFLKQELSSIQYTGIDASMEMIEIAKQKQTEGIDFFVKDIMTIESFDQPAIIICNLVLQFIPIMDRLKLLHLFYEQLPTNGALIIVEKIRHNNDDIQSFYTNSFHQFKLSNGYSMNEILNKQQSLNGVLLPETNEFYINNLQNIGFNITEPFFKWYNFSAHLAVKE